MAYRSNQDGSEMPELIAPAVSPQLRLPTNKNKVERIADHSKGLVDDVKAWVELRLKLTQLEVETKVQEQINKFMMRMAPLVVLALGGLFLLVTIALGLGWWLGQPFWGFLIVTVVLLAGGMYMQYQSPQDLANQDPRQIVQVSKESLSENAS